MSAERQTKPYAAWHANTTGVGIYTLAEIFATTLALTAPEDLTVRAILVDKHTATSY